METYRQDLLAKAGITDIFVQDNHARSLVRNTVRGLHFQWNPPVAKLVRVTRGSAFLVAIDIRKNSPTLGQWVGIEASAENKNRSAYLSDVLLVTRRSPMNAKYNTSAALRTTPPAKERSHGTIRK